MQTVEPAEAGPDVAKPAPTEAATMPPPPPVKHGSCVGPFGQTSPCGSGGLYSDFVVEPIPGLQIKCAATDTGCPMGDVCRVPSQPGEGHCVP